MPPAGLVYIIIGLIFSLAPVCLDKSFGLERYLGIYGSWIQMFGLVIGFFLIIKGREKLGLKNKWFGKNKDLP